MRVDVIVLVDVLEAVLVGLNATPGSIEFVNTIYRRKSRRRMLLFRQTNISRQFYCNIQYYTIKMIRHYL